MHIVYHNHLNRFHLPLRTLCPLRLLADAGSLETIRDGAAFRVVPDEPAFGRDDGTVTPALDRAAHDLLGMSQTIGWSCVYPINTQVQGLLDSSSSDACFVL
jgi:hypothetical protein